MVDMLLHTYIRAIDATDFERRLKRLEASDNRAGSW